MTTKQTSRTWRTIARVLLDLPCCMVPSLLLTSAITYCAWTAGWL